MNNNEDEWNSKNLPKNLEGEVSLYLLELGYT